MTYHIEINDDSVQEFEAAHDGLAADQARATAKSLLATVRLYRGPVVSGAEFLCRFRPNGGIAVNP